MRRKTLFLSVALMFLLVACSSESGENGMTNWLSDQGLPFSYKVQVLSINDLEILSAEAHERGLPVSGAGITHLGTMSGVNHEIFMDFAFKDADFFETLASADSASSFVAFYPVTDLYASKYYFKDSLPLEEEVPVTVSWKLTYGKGKKFVKSVNAVKQDDWYKEIQDFEADESGDTTYSLKITSKRGEAQNLYLPQSFIETLRKNTSDGVRVQLHLSAPDAPRVYHFYGNDDLLTAPILRFSTLSDTTFTHLSDAPLRVANVSKVSDEDVGSLVLHGGINDSMDVELPSKPILDALAEFYGDEFPYVVGDSNDVRQAVVLAQLTFAKDDSQGSQEFNLPIQLLVGSYIDSLGTPVRKMESYKLNKDLIKEEGHPNMLFNDRDSLSLQVTWGVRDFINRASDGRTMKFMVRMGLPVASPKDTSYTNYVSEEGDTTSVFFNYYDHARYDFTSMMSSPVTLKLWLATKRGEE